MISHNSPISGIACWQDSYVATAGYDNQVILWDQASQRALGRVNHDHLANQCAFSPDGKHLVTASSDHTARLWTVPSLRLVAVMADHDDDVEMAAFHPSKPLIATASRDHLVRVFDFTGECVQRFEGHAADVISVEWANDADELISSSDDGTIRRWSLESGLEISVLDMAGVETDTVAIGCEGTIFAGNDDGEITIIAADGARTVVSAHDAGIKRLVVSVDLRLLVSLSYDRTLKIWDLTTDGLSLVSVAEFPSEVWPRSCAFAGQTNLVFGSFGRTYKVFNYRENVWTSTVGDTLGVNAVIELTSRPGGKPGETLAVGDAGIVWASNARMDDLRPRAEMGSLCNFFGRLDDLVVTGGQMGRLFDAESGRLLHQHRSPLNCATAITVDGRSLLVVGSYTGEAIVLESRPELRSVGDLKLLDNAIKGVASNGNMLFAVGADASAVWYDMATHTETCRMDKAHDKIINGCAALADEGFVSISRDLTMKIWTEPGHGHTVTTPHANSIKCVAVDRSRRFIATGGYHGTIAVYDTKTGRWPQVVRPTMSGVSCLSWSDRSNTFLASSYDGKLYDVAPV